MRIMRFKLLLGLVAAAFLLGSAHDDAHGRASPTDAALQDSSGGGDWPAYGRTYGEQHYSPLTDVNAGNVSRLGLAWFADLGPGNPVTQPIAVDGVLYVAHGHSLIDAFDVQSGRRLWTYDPHAAQAAGRKLRGGWGIRGLAYWQGKLYVGTVDGRLIAVDARTGREVWSVLTVEKNDVRYITGAPRVFAGKVVIGHGGADKANIRGYVTAYDARTGKQLWRFYTVPGDPSLGFENDAMKMAAETWSGEWWRYGGGGTVWNAMTYDAEQNLLLIGTGNGHPWNWRVRSAGKGDNLFLCSIIALDATTGAYRWHYQFNPAESWDYNAAMDMALATLTVDGQPRKVVMTAPKNGFFYVLDRTNGKLISATPYVKVNWASKIDVATGRPVEEPGIRYENGQSFTLRPGGGTGSHSWLPMAFSPRSGLAYIPSMQMPMTYNDARQMRDGWKMPDGFLSDGAVDVTLTPTSPDPEDFTSALVAIDPVTRRIVWKQPTPGQWGGGLMATAGDLVFGGQVDRKFNAYDARNGKILWSFDGGAPVLSPPLTYRAGGRQFITVVTGAGTGPATTGLLWPGSPPNYRTQKRRILTFVLDGRKALPADADPPARPAADPGFQPDAVAAQRGAAAFRRCVNCHGGGAVAGGVAPDLRASPIPTNALAFARVVRDGALAANGMPAFDELTDGELDDLRQYIRTAAAKWRNKLSETTAKPAP